MNNEILRPKRSLAKEIVKKSAGPLLATMLVASAGVGCRGLNVDRLHVDLSTPTTGAAAGTPGPQGPRGEIGPRGPKGEKGDAAVATPEATQVAFDREIDIGNGKKIGVTNIPDSVSGDRVDIARGNFKSTIQNAGMIFAEPGALLIGPDNPEIWDDMRNSKGAINTINPVNQGLFRTNGPEFQNLPEGGFILGSWAKAQVELGDVKINMPDDKNTTIIFAARGLFGDNKQNTDNNITAKFSNYFPGHAQVMMYPPLRHSNAGFISEDQFKEIVGNAHSQGNSGDGGSSRVLVVLLDMNTKAFNVLAHVGDRSENVDTGWKTLYSNVK